MKFIGLIFAFLTLVLSSVPCSDGVNETANTIQTENHSEHSGDGCSPFCTCACCGIDIPFEVLVFEDENVNAIIQIKKADKNIKKSLKEKSKVSPKKKEKTIRQKNFLV